MEGRRPYYHEFAWAYDVLQTDPVGPRVDFVQRVLSSQSVRADGSILDAGCGTGRYALELAKRGYQVCGVDRSPELVMVARNRAPGAAAGAELIVADLLAISFYRPFDAVLCRGVLNDFVQEPDRKTIFCQFARWLRTGGLLIFDVREWERSVARYEKSPIHERSIDLPDGRLRFQSETLLDMAARRLCVRECFEIEHNNSKTSTVNDFVMGCWTSEEVGRRLHATGFDQTAVSESYGESDRTWSDRLVVIARKLEEEPGRPILCD